MRAAISALGCIALVALCSCGSEPQEQNIVITNDIPPDAEIETLPPDESVATPTDELANGADEPDMAPANNGE